LEAQHCLQERRGNVDITWSLTCVYGPQGEVKKIAFIEEIK
jgi:hypothetical protein